MLGVAGNGIHSAEAIYDEQRINQRSKLISYAISARAERFEPTITSHSPINPCSGMKKLEDIADYNLLDLGI